MSGNDNSDLQIVVVDDSDFTRKAIIDALEKENLKVVGEADSAAKAVNLIGTTSGNLYIIDVVMPESSGLEVAKIIQDEKKDCFVILMSSLRTELIIIDAITNGACDFLQKPFSKEQLLTSVYKVKHEMGKGDVGI